MKQIDTEGPSIMGATVKKFHARLNWRLGFIYPGFK
jgi:hypothetical protein